MNSDKILEFPPNWTVIVVDLLKQQQTELIESWLNHHVGREFEQWAYRCEIIDRGQSCEYRDSFYFADEKMATLFSLTWA